MRATLIVVAVLVAACSSDSQPAVSNRSPTQPSITQGFGFSCRLPIAWTPADARADGSNSGTGFLQAADRSISDTAALPAPHFLTGGPSYDAVADRWLPVPVGDVSPDGTHYAYAEWDPPSAGAAGSIHGANSPLIGAAGRVHLVDATTGADRVLYSGEPAFYVLRFAAEGIYLEKFSASVAGTAATGLYLLALSGGAPRAMAGADAVLSSQGWADLEAGAAWGTTFTAGIASEQGPGNRLVRYDVATHALASWLTVPEDHTIFLLGVYSGSPIVLTIKSSVSPDESTDGRVLVLKGANSSTEVLRSVGFNDPVPSAAAIAVADSHGLWLGGLGTLWFYRSGTGLRHVSLLAADSLVTVAGSCT